MGDSGTVYDQADLEAFKQNIEIDRYRPSADDEEGMHLVQKPFLSPDLPILPAFSRSDELAQTIWVMSGNPGDMQIEAQDLISRLARDR